MSVTVVRRWFSRSPGHTSDLMTFRFLSFLGVVADSLLRLAPHGLFVQNCFAEDQKRGQFESSDLVLSGLGTR